MRYPVIASPASGGTLALTGVSGTSAIGALGVALALAMSGIQGTASAGTLSADRTIALSGVSATAAVGSITPSRTVALVGVAGTGAAGTVTPVRIPSRSTNLALPTGPVRLPELALQDLARTALGQRAVGHLDLLGHLVAGDQRPAVRRELLGRHG